MPATSSSLSRAVRVLRGLTLCIVATGALFAIAWAVITVRARPLDGVEGENLFEALRIRAHLPLYVDPIVGTQDTPPSRYYVLYPPLWSALLSIAPTGLFARALALVSWLGAVLFIALRASETPLRARPFTVMGAGFVLSFFALMLFGAAGRPDAFALLLAAIAFVRVLRGPALDVPSAILFALAVLVKPNVMGLALGVFGSTLFVRPREALRPIAAGVATGVLVAGALMVISRGAFLDHLLRSTAQPLSLALWLEQLALRLPFVAVPLVLAAAFAWPSRHDRAVRLALSALLASTAWALFSLAKIGSASNYWMEPSLAALACVATSEVGARRQGRHVSPALAIAIAALLVAQALHNGVAAVRSSIEGITRAFDRAAVLERVRAACRVAPTDLIMADEPGLELALNGRALGTPYQMAHLFARDRLPREPWLADLEHPSIRCLVVQSDELELAVARPIEHRRIDPKVRDAMRARFVRAPELSSADLFVYRRR